MDTATIEPPRPVEEPKPRREFVLSEDDRDHLDAMPFRWEAVREGNVMWLHVHDYALPPGYTPERVRLALRIVPTYPADQIDMVYVSPPIELANKRPIAALSPTTIDGVTFQQWSRHRTSHNPWRSGVDNIGTHLLQVANWFERETLK